MEERGNGQTEGGILIAIKKGLLYESVSLTESNGFEIIAIKFLDTTHLFYVVNTYRKSDIYNSFEDWTKPFEDIVVLQGDKTMCGDVNAHDLI